MQTTISRRQFLTGAIAAGLTMAALPTLSACSQRPSTKAEDNMAAYKAGDSNYYLFTDDCGREVALPNTIKTIAPSGAYAQVILATITPEKMACLSSTFSSTQLNYLDARLSTLPVLGRFYGKNGDMNYEEIIKLSPDVIIDTGEDKENIKEDMDGLQEQTGLPVIFINATTPNLAAAFTKLGKITGCEERANTQAAYIQGVFDYAAARRPGIAAQGLRVAYCGGAYGYDVRTAGSIHAMPLELVGVTNVAKIEGTTSTEVSPEQMLIWNPEVVLLTYSDGFYDYIYDDSTWAPINAVKNKRVYEVPGRPYEWLDLPPSVQTILGTLWLGNLLYPSVYNFSIVEKAQEFFKLFWNYDLSTEEAKDILQNSVA